jgi:hypothetical protein
MDLFNEQLYTKACGLLLRMVDKTNNYDRLTRRIVQLIEELRQSKISIKLKTKR